MGFGEGFTIKSGNGIVKNIFESLDNSLVITQNDIWEKISSGFSPLPENVCFLETLEIDVLEDLSIKNSSYKSIVGIGGGRAADIAKFIHWKNGIPLYQVPTIVSVDAFFTHEIAIREGGVVKYIGNAVPEAVYVDYSIIKEAPVLLNRSGLGDILSCHTGLFDWRLASSRGEQPEWNEDLAGKTEMVLDDVLSKSEQIRCVTDEGIQVLMDTLNWIGHQCYVQKHPRFEEGSEHHFVYNLEYQTGKHFVHGQAVCLGCYILSILQDNKAEEILSVIRKAGIDISPESLGVSWDDIRQTFLTLNDFVRKENLPYTILYEKDVTDDFFKAVKASLD